MFKQYTSSIFSYPGRGGCWGSYADHSSMTLRPVVEQPILVLEKAGDEDLCGEKRGVRVETVPCANRRTERVERSEKGSAREQCI
jgi:hypothetical protein